MKFNIGNRFSVRTGKDATPPAKAEIGATGTSVFAGLLYETEYNTDLQGENGVKTYDRMRRSDGQVKAGLLACKLPLMVAKWDVVAGGDSDLDREIAETVKADLFDNMTITWDNFLRQTLLMLDYGHMVFEKVWEMRADNKWHWRKLAPRLPASIAEWHLDDDGGLDYLLQRTYKSSKFIEAKLPADKVLVFTHEMEGSDFRGISLLRAAYKHWYYKNNLYAIDGIAAERHGVGLPYIQYPDNATQDQKDYIDRVGQRLHAHERAYAAFPESIKLQLLGVTGQLHNILGSIEHHDLQMVRSILAQFMNLGAKELGSYALSNDQSRFFLMALQAVGTNIRSTINRYCIRQMVDYNWEAGGRYPKLTVSGLDDPEVAAYATAVSSLFTSGGLTWDNDTENELRRIMRLPQKARPKPQGPTLHLSERFWRQATSMEKSVAFAEIDTKLDSAENKFIKAVKPIQKRQIQAMVDMMADYLESGQHDKITEIDIPYRAQVADAIDDILEDLVDYGSEQVKKEKTRQGATMKAQEVPPPTSGDAFLRVRALTVANILANKLRASLSYEALRQLRAGELDKLALIAALTGLSDHELQVMAQTSVSEAFNLGRQQQAQQDADEIDRVISSALMDDNTCDYCRSMDGKEWKYGEQPPEPPYPDCEGQDRCRCIFVYVYKSEAV